MIGFRKLNPTYGYWSPPLFLVIAGDLSLQFLLHHQNIAVFQSGLANGAIEDFKQWIIPPAADLMLFQNGFTFSSHGIL
jgi:hypothetical protein